MLSDWSMKYSVIILLTLSPLLQAGDTGSWVQYMGGTVSGVPNKSTGRIEIRQDDVLKLSLHGSSLTIPYKDVTTIEYGMRTSRRYLEAALISPMFLIGKRKAHFLTIGYTDAEGRQQAVVLEVPKDDIRPLLVSLEARTGRVVEFQDEEARKAGKG